MKLIDYIKGSRRGREANRMERQAMEDPFVAEAIEGYDSVYGNHSDKLKELQQAIDMKASKPRRKRRSSRPLGGRTLALVLSVAAVMVVVAGTMWYFVKMKPDMDAGPVIAMSETVNESISFEDIVADEMNCEETDKELVGDVTAEPMVMLNCLAMPDDVASDIQITEGMPQIVAAVSQDEVVDHSDEYIMEEVVSARSMQRAEMKMEASGSPVQQSQSQPQSSVRTVSNPDFATFFKANRKPYNMVAGSPVRGEVLVEFRVNSKGVPSDIRVISGISQETNAEVVSLLSRGPAWEPTGNERVRTVIVYE